MESTANNLAMKFFKELADELSEVKNHQTAVVMFLNNKEDY